MKSKTDNEVVHVPLKIDTKTESQWREALQQNLCELYDLRIEFIKSDKPSILLFLPERIFDIETKRIKGTGSILSRVEKEFFLEKIMKPYLLELKKQNCITSYTIDSIVTIYPTSAPPCRYDLTAVCTELENIDNDLINAKKRIYRPDIYRVICKKLLNQCTLFGGAVIELYRNPTDNAVLKIKDWDPVTTLSEEQLIALGATKSRRINDQWHLILSHEGNTYMVDIRRIDLAYSAPIRDRMNRDTTISKLGANPFGTFEDSSGMAIKDLDKMQLRMDGVPSKRFDEDAVRLLRIIKKRLELKFTIVPETAQAMKAWIPSDNLDRERLFAFTASMLMKNDIAAFVDELIEYNLLEKIYQIPLYPDRCITYLLLRMKLKIEFFTKTLTPESQVRKKQQHDRLLHDPQLVFELLQVVIYFTHEAQRFLNNESDTIEDWLSQIVDEFAHLEAKEDIDAPYEYNYEFNMEYFYAYLAPILKKNSPFIIAKILGKHQIFEFLGVQYDERNLFPIVRLMLERTKLLVAGCLYVSEQNERQYQILEPYLNEARHSHVNGIDAIRLEVVTGLTLPERIVQLIRTQKRTSDHESKIALYRATQNLFSQVSIEDLVRALIKYNYLRFYDIREQNNIAITVFLFQYLIKLRLLKYSGGNPRVILEDPEFRRQLSSFLTQALRGKIMKAMHETDMFSLLNIDSNPNAGEFAFKELLNLCGLLVNSYFFEQTNHLNEQCLYAIRSTAYLLKNCTDFWDNAFITFLTTDKKFESDFFETLQNFTRDRINEITDLRLDVIRSEILKHTTIEKAMDRLINTKFYKLFFYPPFRDVVLEKILKSDDPVDPNLLKPLGFFFKRRIDPKILEGIVYRLLKDDKNTPQVLVGRLVRYNLLYPLFNVPIKPYPLFNLLGFKLAIRSSEYFKMKHVVVSTEPFKLECQYQLIQDNFLAAVNNFPYEFREEVKRLLDKFKIPSDFFDPRIEQRLRMNDHHLFGKSTQVSPDCSSSPPTP